MRNIKSVTRTSRETDDGTEISRKGGRKMAHGIDTFAKRLQWLRERKGISRRVLSELCGLGSSQIARYERGEQNPNATSLVALADFFDVSVDYLLCRSENK